MKISREEVNRIATLARLSLDEAEAVALTKDLDAILEYVATLQGLDTSGVEPTAYVADIPTPMRDDEPWSSLTPEAALENAPKAAGGAFVVPKIVDVGN